MSITITGKLNKAASQFQAKDSTGFGLRIGVQYYERKTSSKEWTNYSAAIFAKNPNQVNFLQSALIEGAIVEITARQAKIDEYEGKYSIELIDASIGYIGTVGAPQQQQAAPQQYAPQQQQYTGQPQQQQPQQQQPQQQQQVQQPYTGQPQQPQQPQNNMPMDSSVPF